MLLSSPFLFFFFFFFFFQAEDGIRVLTVTGVQTCALPISSAPPSGVRASRPSTPTSSTERVAVPGRLEERKAAVERKVRARELVFGVQDGLLSTVGLLSGVSVATQSRFTVALTGVAAAGTGALSMAPGSFLAARTEKEIFEKELLDQERLAADQPHLAREALLESLVREGLDRPSAYRVVQMIARDRDLLLRTGQEKVLGLAPADIPHPVKAGTVMFLSCACGAAVPLLPFLLPPGRSALL